MLISTQTGCRIDHAEDRVLAFLREEWPYYDGIADPAPDQITVVDVLAPVMMNAYSFGMGAGKLQGIHRAVAAACEPVLLAIPVDADLRFFDPDLRDVRRLLDAAVSVRNVLVPVATKILHRKRRSLIPVLDNVVLGYYLDAAGASKQRYKTQDKRYAVDIAVDVLRSFRSDLVASSAQLEALSRLSAEAGNPVGPLRLLEMLIWSEVEPRGYYRG